jgi:hypothetical protein
VKGRGLVFFLWIALVPLPLCLPWWCFSCFNSYALCFVHASFDRPFCFHSRTVRTCSLTLYLVHPLLCLFWLFSFVERYLQRQCFQSSIMLHCFRWTNCKATYQLFPTFLFLVSAPRGSALSSSIHISEQLSHANQKETLSLDLLMNLDR